MTKRVYHGFGGRLHHEVPSWARDDALFHIRIRCDTKQAHPLTEPDLAKKLIDSVCHYELQGYWWADVFLLMPDHLHALMAFASDKNMSNVIRSWKRFHARESGIIWQDDFFDHRLRDHDDQKRLKREYILNNPVVLGLCRNPGEWPWRYESQGGPPETHGDQRTR